jgi:hypothetical protein
MVWQKVFGGNVYFLIVFVLCTLWVWQRENGANEQKVQIMVVGTQKTRKGRVRQGKVRQGKAGQDKAGQGRMEVGVMGWI